MTDGTHGLLILVGFHIGVVVIGLTIMWVARRRPRGTAAAIVLMILTGAGLVWYGSFRTESNLDQGRAWFRVGLLCLIYGIPAWVPFLAARERAGDTIGPVGMRAWANGLVLYLVGCWCVALLTGFIVWFGMAEPGSFR